MQTLSFLHNPVHAESGVSLYDKGDPKMKKKRFTEEQIIKTLKACESGAKVPDLSREYGVSEQSICRWKSKRGGMESADAKRVRELESENTKLRKLLAETMIEKEALKDVLTLAR